MASAVGEADARVSTSEAPAPITLSATARRGTLVAVVLGSAVVFLDTSVVNLALPQIGREMGSSLLGTLEAQSYVAYGYFVTLSSLLILAGGLTDYYGRRKVFSLGPAGVRRDIAAVRYRAEHRVPDPGARVAGRGGRVRGAGIAVDHHGELPRRGTGPRVRYLGGRIGGDLHPRAVRRRGAGQLDLVAGGVPDQPAAPGDRVSRDGEVRARVEGPGCDRAFRLAGVDRDRAGRGRAGVRDDPRAAAWLGRPGGADQPVDRRGGGDRVPVHDGEAARTRWCRRGCSVRATSR